MCKISCSQGISGAHRPPGGGRPRECAPPRVADLFKLGVIGGSRPGYVQKCTFDQPDTSGWNRPKYIGLNSAFFDPPGGVPIFRAQCTILDPPWRLAAPGVQPPARASQPAITPPTLRYAYLQYASLHSAPIMRTSR